MKKVTFTVDNTPLVGDLYLPTGETSNLPGVVIIGPMTYQKEQAPTEYAKRLVDKGFAALVYDSRYRGESGGEPRAWENPAHKVDDLKAAFQYLADRSDVNSKRVSILAICQGSSEAFRAAAELDGAYALATIAGHYRDEAGDIEWLSEEGLKARLTKGEAARQRFQDSGVVDYVKAVDQQDMEVGMPGEFVWDWYQPWADRSQWENRYAVMSDADLLAFESISAANSLTTPWLMIHGDNCFIPSAAKRHMAAVPSSTKTQTIWNDTPHLSYYDQAEVIDQAVIDVSAWFHNAA